jgi:RNA polymerase sigma factor (TIGR02999 family)
MNEITAILSAAARGDSGTSEQLLPLVYDELKRLAAHRLAQEKPGQTLQATALVHEAYLTLVDADQAKEWNNRGHFFAAAAEAMRRILVDHARHKGSQRRGGGRQRCELLDVEQPAHGIDDELLDLDEALTKLETVDPQAAQLVQLRVFAGMTVEEAARQLGISPSTAKRAWAYARAWLGREISTDTGPDSPPE